MQGNINGFSAVESNGRKVLIEERLKHDDLVALLQERGEYRILTWQALNTVGRHWVEDDTFVSTTGDYNLGLDVKRPVKGGLVEVLDGLAQAYTSFWMRVVIRQSLFEGLIGSFDDPRGRGEVHVSLAKIDAVSREICGAGRER